MSIENGERFLRKLHADAELREQVKKAGPVAFENIAAAADASATAWEVVVAAIREIERAENR